ncbi:hypothetical protein LOTGIDRAFT_123956 [Lottia gigantea]|uniref:Malate dehydrogenase, cytoplasmic n=1 Tax=Lottia gigantea TaxID=225164 RepID=V4AA40_LOTGI|nr:hypothetical protein LOTGIDRAFT_123956 [Lottia gigantea]ESO90176.1 hypothetical protein LOTGIDRAFT_123956 [Lottia gigantea]
MYLFVGRDDCPYYARAELLGDRLVKNLPDFKIHKIVKTESEWEDWMTITCSERGWETRKSPLVWRELLDRGGKGVLIGGANEFQEYVKGYYSISSDLTSDDMRKISQENKKMKAELDKEEAEFKAQSKPLHVCISNASSPIAYHLINSLASGETFGPSTEITLRLYDENLEHSELLSGLKMEAEDLCHDLLRGVTVTSDPSEAFTNCSAIILIDNLYQQTDESRQDWLKRNAEHYTNYAKIINQVAKKNVKILIAGNGPINLCATMMIRHAPNVPRQNITAMSRMIENYSKSVIGGKLNLNTSNVLDLIIWGNINSKKYIDLSQCKVRNYDGAIWGPPSFTLPAVEMLHDNKWIEGEYLEIVQQRKTKVREALNHSASVSFSSAIITMLQHWWNGTPKGQLFSLAVCSEGWYDVPEGLVFSFPITMHPKGYWNVVQDIEVPTDVKAILLEIVSVSFVLFGIMNLSCNNYTYLHLSLSSVSTLDVCHWLFIDLFFRITVLINIL